MRTFVAIVLLSMVMITVTAQEPSVLNHFKTDHNVAGIIPEKFRPVQNALKSGTRTDLPKKIEWFSWGTSDWVPEKTVTKTYNTVGFTVTELWDCVSTNNKKITYTYNAGNKLTEYLEQVLNNGIWVDSIREILEYDSHGYMTLDQGDDYVAGAWVTSWGQKTDFEYNGDQVIKETTEGWNAASQAYVDDWRYTYTYENGIRTAELAETFENGAWTTKYRSTYYYAGTEEFDYILTEFWTGTAWIPNGKTIYSFYGQSSWTITDLAWDSVAKVYNNYYRYNEEIDSHNNLTLFSVESWVAGAWTIELGERFTIVYDGEHAVSRITEMNNPENPYLPAGWVKMSKELFSDFLNLGTDPIATEPPGIFCFPNPAGKLTLVQITLPKAGTFILAVYSMTGQKVFEETVNSNGSDIRYQLNLNKVLPGSYILKASDKNGNELGKTRLIKQ